MSLRHLKPSTAHSHALVIHLLARSHADHCSAHHVLATRRGTAEAAKGKLQRSEGLSIGEDVGALALLVFACHAKNH